MWTFLTSTTVRWLIFRGKRSMSNHSRRRKSSVGDKVLSLSTEVVHFAFTDFTVDSWHPLSPVPPTTIEVARRTWICVVFDTMLLAVLLSMSTHSSRICFSISLVRFSHWGMKKKPLTAKRLWSAKRPRRTCSSIDHGVYQASCSLCCVL